MHLIVRDGTSLDEIGEPRDLGLPPADFIILSFSDSDLAVFRSAVQGPLTPTLSPRGEGVRCGLSSRAEDHSGVPSPLGG